MMGDGIDYRKPFPGDGHIFVAYRAAQGICISCGEGYHEPFTLARCPTCGEPAAHRLGDTVVCDRGHRWLPS